MRACVFVAALAAFSFSTAALASSVGSPAYEPDQASLLIDLSAGKGTVDYQPGEGEASKVRRPRQRCAKNDEDCPKDE